jgi:fructose-bisphosphate aldolase class II
MISPFGLLYKDIQEWTLEKYRAANPGKKDRQIIDGNCKFAIKEFFKELYGVPEDTEKAIQALAYAESLVFFKAFSSYGTASLVRKIIA